MRNDVFEFSPVRPVLRKLLADDLSQPAKRPIRDRREIQDPGKHFRLTERNIKGRDLCEQFGQLVDYVRCQFCRRLERVESSHMRGQTERRRRVKSLPETSDCN